jgi:ubiquinone/menaquinone biosynthesis C-methylase UbiE
MNHPDPKTFYNEKMPGKLGTDYEEARWHSNDFLEAQYEMMLEAMRDSVLPHMYGKKRILEVGPGQGTWTKLLLKAAPNANFTLVDISAEMLSRAKNNLPSGHTISFLESDFLAFSQGTYDFFFSSRAIEYMPNKAGAVAKIGNLLEKGGIAVVITKMPKPFLTKLSGREVSSLHSGQIFPQELIRLFQSNGFRLKRLRLATATLPGFNSAILNRVVYKILSKIPLLSPLSLFAESYIVVFEKTS